MIIPTCNKEIEIIENIKQIMTFFKFNKELKTEDLKLSDYDKIWTKFCFLDETGVLSDRQEQYFTIEK